MITELIASIAFIVAWWAMVHSAELEKRVRELEEKK